MKSPMLSEYHARVVLRILRVELFWIVSLALGDALECRVHGIRISSSSLAILPEVHAQQLFAFVITRHAFNKVTALGVD
jgi:hypothetical protein